MTYTILDLFCGAGGAAKGYADAGFEVVGIDSVRQPNYPFEFHWVDAIAYLDAMLMYSWSGIDAIHASPPCQGYSAMSRCRPGLADKYPKLIEPVRERLEKTGLPYVIENVEGAPLKSPVRLCATSFPHTEVEFNGNRYGLQRHRLFETNWALQVPPCGHYLRSFPVYGDGAPGNRPDLRGPGYAAASRKVMHIDWATRAELAEAIPPYYTEYIGRQLIKHLNSTSNRRAA